MPNVAPLERAELAEFEQTFQLVEEVMGFVPTSLFIMGRRPEMLRAFSALSAVVLVGGTVDRSLRQLVACSYRSERDYSGSLPRASSALQR